MGISLSGIFSGMNTTTIVSQLMALNRQPVNKLYSQKSLYTSRQSAVSELERRMTSLRDLAGQLKDSSQLRAFSTSSSDSAILGVSASGSSSEGFHQVVVESLATAQRRVQVAGMAALDSSIGASKSTATNAQSLADADETWFTAGAEGATYTFQIGSEAAISNVTFDANTAYSLNQVAAVINARSQALASYDAAQVVQDNGQYTLKLTARQLGPVGNISATLTAGDSVASLETDGWTTLDGQAGTFAYTYKGVTRTIQSASGTTLENLRDQINNDSGNPGIKASTLFSGGTYHLVLSAKETGSGNEITIEDSQTTLVGFSSADLVQTQAAQNAKIRLDGYPSETWIERSSNTISDVLPGATFQLKSTGTVTVSISRDTQALSNHLSNLVAIYNGLVDKLSEYTGYNAEKKTGGLLQGDSIRNLMDQVRQALIVKPRGFTTGEDAFTLSGQIGLSFDRYGKLSLDSAKLQESVDSNYQGVLSLVGAMGSGTSNSQYLRFSSAAMTTSPGSYELEVDYSETGQIETARIRKEGELVWRFLSIDGGKIMATEGDEAGLIMMAASDGTVGAHTQSAIVQVKRGIAGTIFSSADTLLNSTSGVFATKAARMDAGKTAIQKNIDMQESRLEKTEKRLKDQFARLEATLAKMDAQNGAFQSLFQTLASNSNS